MCCVCVCVHYSTSWSWPSLKTFWSPGNWWQSRTQEARTWCAFEHGTVFVFVFHVCICDCICICIFVCVFWWEPRTQEARTKCAFEHGTMELMLCVCILCLWLCLYLCLYLYLALVSISIFVFVIDGSRGAHMVCIWTWHHVIDVAQQTLSDTTHCFQCITLKA